MRLRLRIQGELSILQIAQFVKPQNKNFYTTLTINNHSYETSSPAAYKKHFYRVDKRTVAKICALEKVEKTHFY